MCITVSRNKTGHTYDPADPAGSEYGHGPLCIDAAERNDKVPVIFQMQTAGGRQSGIKNEEHIFWIG
jgi:hypothetical protein